MGLKCSYRDLKGSNMGKRGSSGSKWLKYGSKRGLYVSKWVKMYLKGSNRGLKGSK